MVLKMVVVLALVVDWAVVLLHEVKDNPPYSSPLFSWW